MHDVNRQFARREMMPRVGANTLPHTLFVGHAAVIIPVGEEKNAAYRAKSFPFFWFMRHAQPVDDYFRVKKMTVIVLIALGAVVHRDFYHYQPPEEMSKKLVYPKK